MPNRAYFHHESEVIGGDDWFIMCHLDYYLENRLGTKVEAGTKGRRPHNNQATEHATSLGHQIPLSSRFLL